MKKLSIITLTFIGLSFFIACKNKVIDNKKENENPITEEQQKTIITTPIIKTSETSELNLTGKVTFDQDHVLKVFPMVSGIVTKVNVTLGDHVAKGQVLATINSSDISDYQSQNSIAESQVNAAKRKLEVANELYKTNVNSLQDVNNANNDYKIALSQLNKTNQTLKVYGVNPNGNASYNIVSPATGDIVERTINEGMTIRSDNSMNVFTVSSLKNVWVMANCFENDLRKIKIGENVTVTTLAYPNKKFVGVIAKTSEMLDPNTRSLMVFIKMNNDEKLLKPEMFATINIPVFDNADVLSVPTDAVVFIKSKNYVMVCNDKKTVSKREITVLNTQNGMTFITGDVKESDQVITKNALYYLNALMD